MSILTDIEFENQYPDLYESLHPLLRSKSEDLRAYLEKVACKVAISGTNTQAHCYFIAFDGNRRPRIKDFAKFLAVHIVNFAIPRSEINRALNEDYKNASTVSISKLNMKARNLFAKLPKSGEGGEVLLSLLAEAFLDIPQLFTKMVLKTNSEIHVHGSDGIHAGTTKNGGLALYWGESKLYQDPAKGIQKCFESLSPFLLDDGGSNGRQERDLQLMRDGLSIDDPCLLSSLKRFLDPDDPLFNTMEYRGLCLVGFDLDSYPTAPNSKDLHKVKQEVETVFEQNKKQILKRVKEETIESFIIEIFCLPFPSVEKFREAFRNELGLNNEQD